jgi:mono/diheme cytochrome c family protein
VGDPVAGQTAYNASCSGCHTANVAANVMNVTKATTVSALDSANAKVGAMSFLATTLTAKQKLDITAYIASAK